MKTHRSLCLLAIILSLCSCGKECAEKVAEDIMGKWHHQQVKFPEKLELLNENKIADGFKVNIDSLANGADFYIIHYFDANCDKCVHELSMAQQFIESHPARGNVKYIFIADGTHKTWAQQAIDSLHFRYPVYFEKVYTEFKKINKFPLNSSVHNTSLMNNKNELLLLGAFFNNEKAEDLYYGIIDGCAEAGE
jgi:hypothetical protein